MLDRAPTIGDHRRQSVIAMEVRCQRLRMRVGRVELEALRLPDETIFQHIPKLRRLRCSQCDRLVAEIAPIFPPLGAPKLGELRPALWIVVTKESDGRQGWSSPLWSRGEALRCAKSQIERGAAVPRIEGPAEIIGADEIAAWCASGGRV